jgi:transposase
LGQLDEWIVAAKTSGIEAMASFATGLESDRTAVEAALKHEWSNGQLEGQINRLKAIKRSMFGRAKFDLLRKRVLAS